MIVKQLSKRREERMGETGLICNRGAPRKSPRVQQTRPANPGQVARIRSRAIVLPFYPIRGVLRSTPCHLPPPSPIRVQVETTPVREPAAYPIGSRDRWDRQPRFWGGRKRRPKRYAKDPKTILLGGIYRAFCAFSWSVCCSGKVDSSRTPGSTLLSSDNRRILKTNWNHVSWAGPGANLVLKHRLT